jgi:hypothetical protein
MKREVGKFLIISLSSLVLLNFAIIGASIAFQNYGRLTLNPGEDYIVNIPFIGNKPAFQTICGKAEQTDGTALKNISVILREYNTNTTIAQDITGSDGKYCITLPRLTSSEKFDIYLEYESEIDGENLTLADHGYELNFEDGRVYSKGSDTYATLIGNITNEYAKIENGRFEIKVGYNDKKPDGNNSWKYIFGDYEKYFININSNEIYEIPNEELDISWEIPYDASPGEYKFLIRTSFNAIETSNSVYFNITE